MSEEVKKDNSSEFSSAESVTVENPVVKNPNDTITIKKDTLWKYSTFLLLGVLIVGGIVFFMGGDNGGTPTAAVIGAPSAPTAPSQVTASADDDARIGSPNAPVEIIEFSDFQCPFCGRVAPTLKQIVAEYGDDVSIVYRDFPLDSIHPFATPAAIAAECVREQGDDEAFFEYHDKIFEGQAQLSDASLKSWAKELGFDIDSCLDSEEFLSEVRKDLSDAQAAGGLHAPAHRKPADAGGLRGGIGSVRDASGCCSLCRLRAWIPGTVTLPEQQAVVCLNHPTLPSFQGRAAVGSQPGSATTALPGKPNRPESRKAAGCLPALVPRPGRGPGLRVRLRRPGMTGGDVPGRIRLPHLFFHSAVPLRCAFRLQCVLSCGNAACTAGA